MLKSKHSISIQIVDFPNCYEQTIVNGNSLLMEDGYEMYEAILFKEAQERIIDCKMCLNKED